MWPQESPVSIKLRGTSPVPLQSLPGATVSSGVEAGLTGSSPVHRADLGVLWRFPQGVRPVCVGTCSLPMWLKTCSGFLSDLAYRYWWLSHQSYLRRNMCSIMFLSMGGMAIESVQGVRCIWSGLGHGVFWSVGPAAGIPSVSSLDHLLLRCDGSARDSFTLMWKAGSRHSS